MEWSLSELLDFLLLNYLFLVNDERLFVRVAAVDQVNCDILPALGTAIVDTSLLIAKVPMV